MEKAERKLAPHYRQDWRSKAPVNSAVRKYTREYILKNYKNLKEPEVKSRESVEEIILHEPNPPLLTAFFPFTHPFGEEPNSRKYQPREKRVEQVPEWYDDEEPIESVQKVPNQVENVEKPAKKEEHTEVKIVLTSSHVRNLPSIDKFEGKDLEERFTKIDLQVEEKLKSVQNEDDYAEPDWDEPTKEEFTFEPIKVAKPSAAVYDMNLLRYHFAIGNPFAQTLIDFGVPLGKNALTFAPDTKPYEKIWYYKDLEGQVHGAFSTLEMFAWTIRDCFPADLEIAIGGSMYFVPMNIFNSVPQMPEPVFYQNKSAKEGKKKDTGETKGLKANQSQNKPERKKNYNPHDAASGELKNMLGINKRNK